MTIKVFPSVFHPGWFYSTKCLIRFSGNLSLMNKKVLDLGTGSGMLAIALARQGANVTAVDINQIAVECTMVNAKNNQVSIDTFRSDLFSEIKDVFDFVFINPPYYPKPIKTPSDLAWYCGERFEYYYQLFEQLHQRPSKEITFMILSEDCNLEKINEIAHMNHLELNQEDLKVNFGEKNFIFEIKKQLGWHHSPK